MKDAKRKFISLRPGKVNEKNIDPEMIIDRIQGPGLTVISSESLSIRYHFMRQMAVAVATGQKFLDNFDVQKSKVLFIAGGIADYTAFKKVVDHPVPYLDLIEKWPQLGKGCFAHLDNYISSLKGHGLCSIFLGEYEVIKRRLPHSKDDLITVQDSAREKEFEDIKRIRDWSFANNVSVIIGHRLSTRGKLYYGGAINNRDNELRILYRGTRSNRRLVLEVAEGSNYLTVGEWDLEYDSMSNSLSLKKQEECKESMVQQGTNPNDVAIFEVIHSANDFPTYQEIEEVTGLPHSTAHGRLKSLAKRDRIVKINDKPIRWMANPNLSALSMSNMVDK
jgi:hypothetical protein